MSVAVVIVALKANEEFTAVTHWRILFISYDLFIYFSEDLLKKSIYQ